jgi:hypothetical protein
VGRDDGRLVTLGSGCGRRRVKAMPYTFRVCYDWLYLNGIDECIPDRPAIVVDERREQLSVTCWVWDTDAPDRWNMSRARVTRIGDDLDQEIRTVPLRVPLTDLVRRSLAECGATLTETM